MLGDYKNVGKDKHVISYTFEYPLPGISGIDSKNLKNDCTFKSINRD